MAAPDDGTDVMTGPSSLSKVFHTLVPADGGDEQAFRADWTAYAARLRDLAEQTEGFCFYVRTPRSERSASLAAFHGDAYSYEGVDVVAFDATEPARRFRDRAASLAADFLSDGSDWFVTREHVLTDGAPVGALDSGPGIKVVASLKRLPGLGLEAFRRHWLVDHAPLVQGTAGISRYVQNHLVDEEYAAGEPRYDGLIEVWHRTVADQQACFEDPLMTRDQAADIPTFIDTSTFFSMQCTDEEDWVAGHRPLPTPASTPTAEGARP